MPHHLLFPLFSSICFVFGMMFARSAIVKGTSPWTGTFFGNLWLAMIWSIYGISTGELLPAAGWWQAAAVGLTFFLGQLLTYLAFQYGDVSVATPIFGVKVIIVALLAAWLANEPVPINVWIAALLATAGVAFVQAGTGHAKQGDSQPTIAGISQTAVLTTLLALLAALSLSLFDVGLQTWGRHWKSHRFLPVMFFSTGVFSCGVLPWVDRPRRLRELRTGRLMLTATLLMALQAMSMSYSLAAFGDATRINIVYALRGIWAVVLAWMLSRFFGSREANLSSRVMLLRLFGAALLVVSVFAALVRF
ncbi:MAG: EamA family transporter [Planctomycetota bacterium]